MAWKEVELEYLACWCLVSSRCVSLNVTAFLLLPWLHFAMQPPRLHRAQRTETFRKVHPGLQNGKCWNKHEAKYLRSFSKPCNQQIHHHKLQCYTTDSSAAVGFVMEQTTQESTVSESAFYPHTQVKYNHIYRIYGEILQAFPQCIHFHTPSTLLVKFHTCHTRFQTAPHRDNACCMNIALEWHSPGDGNNDRMNDFTWDINSEMQTVYEVWLCFNVANGENISIHR